MKKLTKIAIFSFVLSLMIGGAGVVLAAGVLTSVIDTPTVTTVKVGQAVSFSGRATGGGGSYNLNWNFGDGLSADGSTATHTFTQAGTKTVVLKVVDIDQKIANTSLVLTVNPADVTPSAKPIISNISHGTPTQTSVTITWDTDIIADSRVIYDTKTHATSTASNDPLFVAPNFGYVASAGDNSDGTGPKVKNHSVTISGLNPGTKYYFRVLSQG
ncbi:MAG: PKD domain-containing protein [Candidatus Vogelbacteria bacterium]|nr:PKD domain-containing protein [Candidatus Vogelbacteria bacterium]